MKKKIILGVIVLIAGFAVVFSYKGFADKASISQNKIFADKKDDIVQGENINKNGPVIEVDQKTFDFGIVKYGDVSEHIFKITNTGNENLEILKLSTSCGCTKATINEEDKIILPGEAVDMIVTFDPAVHKDDSDLGELQRIVYIRTNDFNNNETEVEIRANVVK
jgi:hypothetical protein